MFRILATLTTLACLAGAGLIHGRWASELEGSQFLQQAVQGVDLIDLHLGDWKGTPVETDDYSFKQAGAQTYWMRNYVNSKNRASVMVILMAGQAKRMAVHTPEVCYQGAGFNLTDGPHLTTLADDISRLQGQFWAAKFRKQGIKPIDLRLLWGWSVNGQWLAPKDARWEFAGKPFLYKLYVSRELANPVPAKLQDDPACDLLKNLMPELDRKLFFLRPG